MKEDTKAVLDNLYTASMIVITFVGMVMLTAYVSPAQQRMAPDYSSIYDAVKYEPDSALYDGFQNRVISCVLSYKHRIKEGDIAPDSVKLRIRKWNINDILWFYVPGDEFYDDDGELVEAVTYFDQYYDKPLVIYVAGHYIKTYEVVGHELFHVITEYLEHDSKAYEYCEVG